MIACYIFIGILLVSNIVLIIAFLQLLKLYESKL